MMRFAAGRRGCAAAAVLYGSLVWASCEVVKEDRRDCPCTLAVEMRALPVSPVRLFANGLPAGEALRDTCLTVLVSKGPRALLAAVSGALPADGTAVRIPYGSEAPPLYAWQAWADCSGDTGAATVRLRRHYCTLALEPVSPPGWAQPFKVSVRGSVDGWSLSAGEPTDGPFQCTLDAGFRCRLPRQRPESELWLDVVMPEGVVRSFPLGEALARSGYDWTAPDLADIGLRLDLSVSELRLSGGSFREPVTLPLEI